MIENVKTTVRNMGVNIFIVCVTSVTLILIKLSRGTGLPKGTVNKSMQTIPNRN